MGLQISCKRKLVNIMSRNEALSRAETPEKEETEETKATQTDRQRGGRPRLQF